MEIKGFVGEFQDEAICKDCGTYLRNDQGFLLADGSAICKLTDRCRMRQARAHIDAEKAAGTWAPRWRKAAV